MAKHLRALLAAKDDSHYGLHLVGPEKARVLVRHARSLLTGATAALHA